MEKETLRFYNITGTPHTGLGTICTHHWAAEDLEKNIKTTVEKSGANSLLITDYFGNSALHYAAASDALNVAKYIISILPEATFFNNKNITPAHIAAQRNNVAMLKEFEKSPTLLTSVSKKGWTPFHYAVYYGSYESVDFLLKTRKVEVNLLVLGAETFQNSYSSKSALKYYSAIDLAIYARDAKRSDEFEDNPGIGSDNDKRYKRYTAIIDLLVQNYGLPSLHAAVRLNNFPAIGYHLFSNFSPFKGKIDSQSQYRNSTPLHIAAALGNYQVCHSLLQCGCSTKLVDESGFCALELAVIANSNETVNVLIPHSSPDQLAKATFIAADLNHQIILDMLLQSRDLPPSSIDKSQGTHDSILIRLIKRKLYKTACQFLQDRGKDIDISQKDSDGATALHYASAIPQTENPNPIVQILQMPAALKLIEDQDNEGMTPLFYSIRANVDLLSILKNPQNDLEKVYEMFKKPSNYDVLNIFGLSPVVYGICFGLRTKIYISNQAREMKFTLDLIKLLNSKKNLAVTRTFPDYRSNTDLECKCPRIELCSKAYIKLFESDTFHLYIEKMKERHERLRRLSQIELAIETNSQNESDAKAANSKNNYNDFQCIVPGASLLHLSLIFQIRSGVIKGFLDLCTTEDRIVDREDDKGRTPIMYAVLLRRTNLISILIQNNAMITNRDKDGNSIFHYIDDFEVFEALRESMRNLNLSELAFWANNDGELPIHTACRSGCLPVLKQLVSLMHEQDPSLTKDWSFLNTKNNSLQTPLDIALENKHYDCIEFLHSQGVPNLLVESVRKCDFEKVKEYVKIGYPINSYDKDHITPLHAAAMTKPEYQIEIISYLIKHGAEPRVQTLDGKLPIHFAAQHNDINVCLLLFTERFKISSTHSVTQPFLSATNDECRDFLFHYWKREFLSKVLIKFIKRYNLIFNSATEEASMMQKHNTEKHKSGSKIEFIEEFQAIVSQMVFVSEQILLRRTSQNLPFSYRYSLHHLFLVLSTLDFSQYFDQNFEEKLNKFQEDAKQIKVQLSKLIYLFLIPIYWIDGIYTLLQMIKVHLIEKIDNVKLFNQILASVSQTRERAIKYKYLGLPKIDDFRSQGSNEKLDHSDASSSNQKLDSDSNIITQPLNTKENVIVICEGKIEDIQKKPLCIFDPQFYEIVKEFFGPNFLIPRTIPFRNREQIKVVLCEDSIYYIGRSSSIKIPLFFTYIKHHKQNTELTFSIPIGEFKFTSAHNDTLLKIFEVALYLRSQLVHRFEQGMQAIQKSNDKLFKCLVAFKLSGERVVHLRIITVMAGSKEACYDLCKQNMFDLLPHPPIFFNVLAKDISYQIMFNQE